MFKKSFFRTVLVGGLMAVVAQGAFAQETANSLPPASKQYAVLDYYNENGVSGIVVKITDDGWHGLVMSVNATTEPWCANKKLNSATNALSKDDGAKNMEAITQLVNSGKAKWKDFPIFEWARNMGNGWYIPASNELQEILVSINDGSIDVSHSNFFKLEAVLMQYKGHTIWLSGSGPSNRYVPLKYPSFLTMYSSTEAAQGEAYAALLGTDTYENMKNGVGFQIKVSEKSKYKTLGGDAHLATRAVRKF
jgi:hypothetical protein